MKATRLFSVYPQSIIDAVEPSDEEKDNPFLVHENGEKVYFYPAGSVNYHHHGRDHYKRDKNYLRYLARKGKEAYRQRTYRPVEKRDLTLKSAYKNTVRYDKPQPTFNSSSLSRAKEYVFRKLYPEMRDSRVITYEEAIETLDKTTSCGTPFNKEFKDKGVMIDEHPDLLRKLCDDDWDRASQLNTFVPCPCKVSQKANEKRPIEKLEQKKVRTFSATNIISTQRGARLFHDQRQRFFNAKFKIPSSVGMVKQTEWDYVMRQRIGKFDYCFEGDMKEYDASVYVELLEWVCWFRLTCMHQEDRVKYRNHVINHYREATFTPMVMSDGNVYYKYGGVNSGGSNTIDDNTIVNFLLFAYNLIETVDVASYEDYNANTEAFFNGDDQVFSLSEKYNRMFNFTTFIESYKKIGIVVTTPCQEPRKAFDLSFLSHVSRWSAIRTFLPVLDTDKLMSITEFTEGDDDDAIESMIRCAAAWLEGWTNKEARKYIFDYYTTLLELYDYAFREIEEWCIAKNCVKSHISMIGIYYGREYMEDEYVINFEEIEE